MSDKVGRGEKILAMTAAFFSAIGTSGTSLAVYSLVTSKVAITGIGIVVTGVGATIGISVAAGVCVVAGVLLAVWGYKTYVDSANLLTQQIQQEENKRAQRTSQLENIKRKHYVRMLRAAIFFKQSKIDKSSFSKRSELNDVIASLETNHPDIYNKISQGQSLDEPEQIVIAKEMQLLYPAPASQLRIPVSTYVPAIMAGIGMFLSTWGTAIGSSFGITSMIFGSVTVLAACTPIIGWSILAATLAIGLAAGLMVLYCRYKNIQRAAKRDCIADVNKQAKAQIASIENDSKCLKKECLNSPSASNSFVRTPESPDTMRRPQAASAPKSPRTSLFATVEPVSTNLSYPPVVSPVNSKGLLC